MGSCYGQMVLEHNWLGLVPALVPSLDLYDRGAGLVGMVASSILALSLLYGVFQHRQLPYASLLGWLSLYALASSTLTILTQCHLHWEYGGITSHVLPILLGLSTASMLLSVGATVIVLPATLRQQGLTQSLQREIADRQRAEADLRRYERIVSCTTDGICLLDRQGVYKIANQAYLNWHQASCDDIIGHPIKAVLDEATFQLKIQPYFDQCLDGQTVQFELWVDYPHRSSQFISVSHIPYREIDNSISGVVVVVRNLTHLKLVEQSLLQQEAQLKVAQRLTQLGSWELEFDTGQQHWSEETFRIFGLPLDHPEPNQSAFLQRVHPDDRDRIRAHLAQAMKQGTAFVEEYRILRPDGTTRYLETRAETVTDTHGHVTHLIGSIQDRTQHHQANTALRKSEERWQLAIQGNDDGIWDWDLLEDQVYRSARWYALMGYEPHELSLSNQEWCDRIHPDDQNQVMALNTDYLARRVPKYEAEYRLRCKDGSYKWMQSKAQALWDEHDHPLRMVGTMRDISDRKLSQQQLELQAIVTRTMAEGICLVRADDGMIIYANPKFEQMFGYEPGELSGQHVSIVNYADGELDPKVVNQTITQTVTQYTAASYVVHNVKKDGTPFWCEATTSVFEHPDHGTIMVAVQQDISDRKQAEDTIKASLQEKELLLKEIYHRVKNNLQVIYSLLNLQARRLNDPAALGVIQDSQSRVRAMALVHEKLYQSQDLNRINLACYITSLAYSLLGTYRTPGKDISLNIQACNVLLDVEISITCGLILTELISNAFKHGFLNKSKGQVSIISQVLFDRKVVIIVRDDGVGFPPGVSVETHDSLGLQLIQSLTRQIKGDVVYACQAPGTEFKLSFPI